MASDQESELQVASHSLQEQLQQVTSDLNTQALLTQQQAACLERCKADRQQLKQESSQHQSAVQSLQTRLTELQTVHLRLLKQQKASSWRLAQLHHWKHSACRQLRRIVKAWASKACGRGSPNTGMLSDSCVMKQTPLQHDSSLAHCLRYEAPILCGISCGQHPRLCTFHASVFCTYTKLP